MQAGYCQHLLLYLRLTPFTNCVMGGSQNANVKMSNPHFLSALASNNQFIIKLVKMWPGGTPHVVGRNFEDKLRST